MDYAEHVATIRREGRALGDAAHSSGLDAAVAGCPGWSVADLVGHVGRLHRWVTRLVAERPDAGPDLFGNVVIPGVAEILDWYEQGVEPLAGALEGAAPEAEVWSWTGTPTAGFWARRQAHETAVHRWDAEAAAESSGAVAVASIDAALAVDGIDEAFEMLPFRPGTQDLRGGGETIHLHCTDVEGEWLVHLGESGTKVTREHAKGDVAARGAASDLLLFLYNRTTADSLEVFGNTEVLTRWQRDAAF